MGSERGFLGVFFFLSQEKVSKISDSEIGRSLSISSYSNITHTITYTQRETDIDGEREREKGVQIRVQLRFADR